MTDCSKCQYHYRWWVVLGQKIKLLSLKSGLTLNIGLCRCETKARKWRNRCPCVSISNRKCSVSNSCLCQFLRCRRNKILNLEIYRLSLINRFFLVFNSMRVLCQNSEAHVSFQAHFASLTGHYQNFTESLLVQRFSVCLPPVLSCSFVFLVTCFAAFYCL